MAKIKIILGTTRQARFGEQPAKWMLDIAKEQGGADFELVDLRDINLPFFNEATPPAAGQPLEDQNGQKWAQIVDDADGFIIVTGEYDHTIPASLSNALQFLYKEWRGKPVAYVGYGAAVGGSRAIEHLRQVAAQLDQYDIDEHVLIPNYWGQLDENGAWTANDAQVDIAKALVKKLVFWTDIFKDARGKLAA